MPDNKTQPKKQPKDGQAWHTYTYHKKNDVVLRSKENVVSGGAKIVGGGSATSIGPLRVADVTQFEHVVG